MKPTTSNRHWLAIAIIGHAVSVSSFSPMLTASHGISSALNKDDKAAFTRLSMSEWSDFKALEDDDDDLYNDTEELPPAGKMTDFGYADENDPQEFKAEIGENIPAPTVDWEGEPLFLPEGSVVPLSEENVQAILAACRAEIGTMFGYSAENRGVGITGGVDFVDFDGPSVILKLHGRFWHQRTTVLDRVGKYIQGRIPEVIEVLVEDPYELTDEANDNAY